ncbi:RICIN domain-containing protein [Kitasatospora sp. NPDC092948]|uniref:RICIN domain-containing protein n=1 Tax=Kitasatospora sp. NPDC092948 TaxID=3364088 RepID=UPI0038245A2E
MTDSVPAARPRLRAVPPAVTAGLLVAGLLVAAPGVARAEQIPRSTPRFELRNQATGKCLEVADWRTDAGAPVREWTCHGGDNQLWTVSSNNFTVNAHSGMCLDIPGSSTVWGTQVIQWKCGERPAPANQDWGVPGVNSPSVGPIDALGLVLDVPGFNSADGTPVVTWGYNGGLNQTWIGLMPRVNF